MPRLALWFLLTGAGVAAQPVLNPEGAVNAASFLPPASPGGAIAQGSIFTLFGTGLGPLIGVSAYRFPLETTLGGVLTPGGVVGNVSVRILHQSGRAFDALPLYVSNTQINAILPSAVPPGQIAIAVTYDGRTSNAVTAKVVRSSFGIFASGIQNYVSPDTLPLNSPASPARRGQTLILWGTGLGPISTPDHLGPAPGNLAEPIEVAVGGRPAAVDYRGRSGCCAGVDQIQFRVPDDAPPACGVPVQVKLHDGVFSNAFTIAVSADGEPCRDALNLPGAARRWARVSLRPEGAAVLIYHGGTPVDFPARGTCAGTGLGAPGPGGFPPFLDAGPPLTVDGVDLFPFRAGYWSRNLNLGAGTHTVQGTGGRDVGPFRASITAPEGFRWANVSGSRSAGLTVSWTGPADVVAVSGTGGGAEGFLCSADPASGSFTIPPSVLMNLPARFSLEVAGVYQTQFTAPGLDAGVLRYYAAASRVVDLGEPPLAATPVRLPNGRTVLAELAVTGPEQQRGLMQRAELAPGRGMLFLFERPQALTFWMFGTLIPLDILWMDAERRLVFISPNTPPCRSADPAGCPVYGPREPTQYVLEIGAGEAARLGLRLGDRLDW